MTKPRYAKELLEGILDLNRVDAEFGTELQRLSNSLFMDPNDPWLRAKDDNQIVDMSKLRPMATIVEAHAKMAFPNIEVGKIHITRMWLTKVDISIEMGMPFPKLLKETCTPKAVIDGINDALTDRINSKYKATFGVHRGVYRSSPIINMRVSICDVDVSDIDKLFVT